MLYNLKSTHSIIRDALLYQVLCIMAIVYRKSCAFTCDSNWRTRSTVPVLQRSERRITLRVLLCSLDVRPRGVDPQHIRAEPSKGLAPFMLLIQSACVSAAYLTKQSRATTNIDDVNSLERRRRERVEFELLAESHSYVRHPQRIHLVKRPHASVRVPPRQALLLRQPLDFLRIQPILRHDLSGP